MQGEGINCKIVCRWMGYTGDDGPLPNSF